MKRPHRLDYTRVTSIAFAGTSISEYTRYTRRQSNTCAPDRRKTMLGWCPRNKLLHMFVLIQQCCPYNTQGNHTRACLGNGEGAHAERCMRLWKHIPLRTINRIFPSHPCCRVCPPSSSCCGEHRLRNLAQGVCYVITGVIRRRLRDSI